MDTSLGRSFRPHCICFPGLNFVPIKIQCSCYSVSFGWNYCHQSVIDSVRLQGIFVFHHLWNVKSVWYIALNPRSSVNSGRCNRHIVVCVLCHDDWSYEMMTQLQSCYRIQTESVPNLLIRWGCWQPWLRQLPLQIMLWLSCYLACKGILLDKLAALLLSQCNDLHKFLSSDWESIYLLMQDSEQCWPPRRLANHSFGLDISEHYVSLATPFTPFSLLSPPTTCLIVHDTHMIQPRFKRVSQVWVKAQSLTCNMHSAAFAKGPMCNASSRLYTYWDLLTLVEICQTMQSAVLYLPNGALGTCWHDWLHSAWKAIW